MFRTYLKSKIHRATVTAAELNYEGSITIDLDLIEAADMNELELASIVNINNGERFETYIISGDRGSGTICLNGAAARKVQVGDKIIIMTYCSMTTEERETHKPRIVLVNSNNKVATTNDYIESGKESL